MVQQLLKSVADINKKYDTVARATGANFNVFDALESAKELDICRIMFALLNPQGSHGQGTVFLEAFFDIVLKEVDIDKAELHKATVTREHLAGGMRRIDIYIETPSWAIPIEVKLFAADQSRQCADYLKYAHSRKNNCRLYYLTPKLREPSDESIMTDGEVFEEENLSLITFEKDILRWLEICVSQHALRLAPIREVLFQYMAVIRRFTNQLEDNIMNDIVRTIMSSAESIESATNISDSLSRCRIEIMRRLFGEIEKRIPNKLNNEYDWDYSGKDAKCAVNNYPKKNNCPGISYHLKDFTAKGKNVSVWVRCEVHSQPFGCLFVGLCVNIDGEKGSNKSDIFKNVSFQEELIKHGIQTPEECQHEHFLSEWESDWWLFWDFIVGQDGEEIDFRSANTPAYYSLFDKNGFECIVQNCVKAINGFLSRR